MDENSIRDHVARCPLGWIDGKLARTRATTDWDVITWLADLREMVGLTRGHSNAVSASESQT
jgi:hypothetical protein